MEATKRADGFIRKLNEIIHRQRGTQVRIKEHPLAPILEFRYACEQVV